MTINDPERIYTSRGFDSVAKIEYVRGDIIEGIRQKYQDAIAEIERLKAENKAMAEHEGLPTAAAQYVHAIKMISRLRAFVEFIARLASNPTDDHDTRCIEVAKACDVTLFTEEWPFKGINTP